MVLGPRVLSSLSDAKFVILRTVGLKALTECGVDYRKLDYSSISGNLIDLVVLVLPYHYYG